MLTIEFEPPKECEPCACCGRRTVSLTRFVYQDGDAYAIYYARYSDGHPERSLYATISIGEWGDGATPDQRVAFPVEIRATESEYKVRLTEADESPWRDVKFIGRTLGRSEALSHPRLREIFHITDHMVVDDQSIRDHFSA